jgi:hypothetical protein
MLCQVFSAFWNTTICRNNHFNRKQTRDLDWLTDPLLSLLGFPTGGRVAQFSATRLSTFGNQN